MSDRRDIAVWLLAAYLAAAAIAMFGYGLWDAWVRNSDGDMLERFVEYQAFRSGAYPNRFIDAPVEGLPSRYSVYPPYALPMFAVFFEPGGKVQGRLLIESFSLIALFLMGAWASFRLRAHGAAWGVVGALAAAGTPAIKSVVAIGQFSAICTGFVVLQILLLQRGRPFAAGACWAAAMIKPQIGVAFMALFLFNRAWRGLLFGIAILAGLSMGALWWTEVSPWALADHWLFRMSMRFAADSSGFGPATLAEWMGWDHRVVQYATLAALACAVGVLVRIASHDMWLQDFLPHAALCAALGRLLFYHRIYDQVMLFPLVLVCLRSALDLRTRPAIAAACAVAATLWIPQPIQEFLPGIFVIQPAVWILAAIHVGAVVTRPQGTKRTEAA